MVRPFWFEVFLDSILAYSILFAIISFPQKALSPAFKYAFFSLIVIYLILFIRDKKQLVKSVESEIKREGKTTAQF